MRNYFFVVILSISFYINVFGQKPKVKNDPNHDDRPLHFGFSLGLNFMDFYVENSKMAYDSGVVVDVLRLYPGFHVHAIVNFRLAEYFDLRLLPGISFGGERELTYTQFRSNITSIHQEDLPIRLESNFIEMPILIKYKAFRLNNFRPYVIGGGNIRYDLAFTKKTWGKTEKHSSIVLLKSFDYYYEIGIGFDFYLEYFKFTTELKYSIGLRNVLKTKDKKDGNIIYPPSDIAIYTDLIDRLNSRMFLISFHFE